MRIPARPAKTQEEMTALRSKFLKQAMSYIGVPYAKRFHPPECKFTPNHMPTCSLIASALPPHLLAPHHASQLFLDCCGLVRKVVQDLKAELGFHIGPWNQAYMVGSHAWPQL